MIKGWRAIPAVWRVGIVIDTVLIVAYAMYWLVHDPREYELSQRFFTAAGGAGYAVDALCWVGALQLARRLGGAQGIGLRMLAATYIVDAVLELSMQFVFEYGNRHHWETETFHTITRIEQYAWFAAAVLAVAGLAVALWRARLGFAIGGLVAGLVTHPPQPIAKLMFGWLDLGFRGGQVVHLAMSLAHFAVIVGMLLLVACADDRTEPARARAGLRRAATALWMRVAAAVVVPLLAIMLVSANAGDSAVGTWKFLLLGAAIFNIVSLALFAFGLIGAATAAVPDLGRWLLAIAGAAAAWCGGVALEQLEPLYRLLYEGGNERDVLALSIIMPIVATASIALVAIAIRNFAARAGLEDLRARAASAGILLVVLLLASVGIQTLLVPDSQSASGAIVLMLVAAVCALIATGLMARTCRAAAAALEREPSLPTARVIS